MSKYNRPKNKDHQSVRKVLLNPAVVKQELAQLPPINPAVVKQVEQAFARLAQHDDLYQLEEDEPLPILLKMFWVLYELGYKDILDYPDIIPHKRSHDLYALLAEADYNDRQRY